MGVCTSDQHVDENAKAPDKIEKKRPVGVPEAPKLAEVKTETKEVTEVKEVKDDRKTLEQSTAETEALWKTYREEVDVHAKKMKEYYEQASAAHDAKDGAKAKQLSNLGKEEKKLMQDAQKKAAHAIFQAKNPDPHSGTIDLHGLQVDEAVLMVEEQLKTAESHKLVQLRIITGAGHHSEAKGPVIKPAIHKLLKEKEYKWAEDVDNASGGSLTVTF